MPTYPNLAALQAAVDAELTANGNEEITGPIMNDLMTGCIQFIAQSPLNWAKASIESGGGAVTASTPVVVFISTPPTSLAWVDNIYFQYVFLNMTSSAIPLAGSLVYYDLNGNPVTSIPANSSTIIYKGSNSLWVSLTKLGAGSGTVTSVGLSMPSSIFSVANSPITSSGTLAVTLQTQTANTVFAGPSSGSPAAPTFRAIESSDLPAGIGTVTSVGLSMPSAFNVSNSPITSAGTLAVTGAGTTAQYIRGDGTLATYGTATSVPINGLTGATGTNTINNGASLQEWQWNTLAGTSALKLSSTSTAASGNAQRLFEVDFTGANATGGQSTWGSYIRNRHTGSGSNTGGYFEASGGTINVSVHAVTTTGTAVLGVATASGGTAIRGTGTNGAYGVLGESSDANSIGILASNSGTSGSKISFRAEVINAGTSNIAAQFSATGGTINNAIDIAAGALTLNGSAGISGQVLTTGGANTLPTWTTPSTVATSVALSGLTAATGVNNINNLNFEQTWQWNTLSSQNGLSLASSSTAATSNSQNVLLVSQSGANSNASQTTYGARIRNIKSGTGSTNIALELTANSGDNNYALQIIDGTQGVGKVLTSNASGQASWATPTTGTLTGFTTFGSTPNANGGSVSGANIILQPANATNPGGISLIAQSLGSGNKYFTDSVGIGTITPVSILTIKGLTSTAGNYGITQIDASDRLVLQADNAGRVDLFNYNAAAGAVMVLYNSGTATNGNFNHYAFGAKNVSGNLNTTGAFVNTITDITDATMSSKLDFRYMDAANTTGGYTQPNKIMELSAAGLFLPSIPLAGMTAFSATNLVWGGSTKVMAFSGTTPATWTDHSGVQEGGGASIFFGNSTDLWASSNAYNSSGWKYKTTAPAANIGIFQNDVQLRAAPSGSANAALTWTMPIKATYSSGGVAALGGDIIATPGSTTGAQMVVTGSDVTVASLAGTGSRAVLADATGVLSAPVSDRNLKERIKAVNNGIDLLKQLKPVTFYFKKEYENYGTRQQIGFIAQDLQKAMPNSVFENKDGKLGINVTDIIPVLVKSLQEAVERIETLEKEVKQLKKKK